MDCAWAPPCLGFSGPQCHAHVGRFHACGMCLWRMHAHGPYGSFFAITFAAGACIHPDKFWPMQCASRFPGEQRAG